MSSSMTAFSSLRWKARIGNGVKVCYQGFCEANAAESHCLCSLTNMKEPRVFSSARSTTFCGRNKRNAYPLLCKRWKQQGTPSDEESSVLPKAVRNGWIAWIRECGRRTMFQAIGSWRTLKPWWQKKPSALWQSVDTPLSVCIQKVVLCSDILLNYSSIFGLSYGCCRCCLFIYFCLCFLNQ